MKTTLSVLVLTLVFQMTVLWAAEQPKQPVQTREDVYKMIRDELVLTVDIYKSQVEILGMILDLESKDLKQRNSDLRSQIEKLRNLKIFEGKSNEIEIALLQEQLDTTRNDLSNAYRNLEQLNIKLKQTELKILDYYARINSLAKQLIDEVEANRDPKLPPSILQTMKTSYATMLKASAIDGMDKDAFEEFKKATNTYMEFIKSQGGDIQILEYTSMLINENYASGQASQKQYGDLLLFIASYQKMLDMESADKEDLQRRLDELRKIPFGKTYNDKIYFESGSVELSKEAIKTLHEFAASVPMNDEYEIMITGFCDDTPIGSNLKKKYASNWELSLARSSMVVRYMLGTLNFPPEKIIIAGKGEFSGAKSSDDKEKQLSRRVEFRFVPKEKNQAK